jgi:tetratricopeptide (TPR) repeat protein
LVQKSLLRQSAEELEEPRFTMLVTIREFALEQLASRPEAESAVRAAHAAYFQQIAEAATSAEDTSAAYDQLEAEADNLRSVLDWLERREDSFAVLEFASDLRWFWWVRGNLREGQARLEAALRQCPDAPPKLRADALSGLGVLLEASGAYERAEIVYREALELFREVGSAPAIAEALDNLATTAQFAGDFARAKTLNEEALALRRSLGHKPGIAVSLNNLGTLASVEDDMNQAAALFAEARDLSLETGDRWILAISLGNLGGALFRQARDGSGGAAPDDEPPEAMTARAATLLREALTIYQEFGDRTGIADCILSLADIAAPTDPARAVRLLGAIAGLAEETGLQLGPVDSERRESLLAAVRTSLAAETFEEAWRTGAAMTLDEAIAAALAE